MNYYIWKRSVFLLNRCFAVVMCLEIVWAKTIWFFLAFLKLIGRFGCVRWYMVYQRIQIIWITTINYRFHEYRRPHTYYRLTWDPYIIEIEIPLHQSFFLLVFFDWHFRLIEHSFLSIFSSSSQQRIFIFRRHSIVGQRSRVNVADDRLLWL